MAVRNIAIQGVDLHFAKRKLSSVSLPKTSDFVVIGGGILGVTTCREIKRRRPDASVVLLEKEQNIAEHGSGRNSGVIHAGFYYTKDTMKARFCVEGNKRLTEYCESKGLKLNKCGKLVVTQSENEIPQLEELLRRGKINGSEIYEVTEKEAKELEPMVKTIEKAIWSPRTSSADPAQVTCSLANDAEGMGVKICTNTSYLGWEESSRTIRTSQGNIQAGFVVSAAGLYADKIAKDFGLAKDLTILPFKGLYLYCNSSFKLKRHIYPVPDLRNPFLGLHFTVTLDQKVKIGPTATPAFWREQYAGFERFNFEEFLSVVMMESSLLFRSGFDFRKLAFEELKKYWKPNMIRGVSKMVNKIDPSSVQMRGKPGIRAQLIDVANRKLVMDFLTQETPHSMHILNAISPAWTCSLAFCDHVVDLIERKI